MPWMFQILCIWAVWEYEPNRSRNVHVCLCVRMKTHMPSVCADYRAAPCKEICSLVLLLLQSSNNKVLMLVSVLCELQALSYRSDAQVFACSHSNSEIIWKWHATCAVCINMYTRMLFQRAWMSAWNLRNKKYKSTRLSISVFMFTFGQIEINSHLHEIGLVWLMSRLDIASFLLNSC